MLSMQTGLLIHKITFFEGHVVPTSPLRIQTPTFNQSHPHSSRENVGLETTANSQLAFSVGRFRPSGREKLRS